MKLTAENGLLTEDEVLAVLEAIDRGDIILNAEDVKNAVDYYCGDVCYRCSNGWIFTIFNDCGEWDYIAYVIAPDGRDLDFDGIWGKELGDGLMPRLKAFAPKSDAWGIGP